MTDKARHGANYRDLGVAKMTITTSQLTDELRALVEEARMHYEPPRCIGAVPGTDEGGEITHAPIRRMMLRHSSNGTPWASADGREWYRVMDVPRDDETGYGGAMVVLDVTGAPLGAEDGLLAIHLMPDQRIICMVTQTGWNLDHEIKWA